MAKKFKWNKDYSADTLTEKGLEQLIKPRYSDIDLMGFAGILMDALGVDTDQWEDDVITDTAKVVYDELRKLIESGEYDKMIEEEFPVLIND